MEKWKLIAIGLGTMGMLMGCLGAGTDPIDADAKPAHRGGKGTGQASARTAVAASPYFVKWAQAQSDGGSSVEMAVACGNDGVMVGFGSRVSNGNITGVRAYCRDIQADGSLGGTYTAVNGSTLIEATVVASQGYVVTGLGGVVNGSAFSRAVIRACLWDAASRKPRLDVCHYASSDGNSATEAFLMVPAGESPYVFTGYGMSAGFEALKAVQAKWGSLIVVGYLAQNLSGGDIRYPFTKPAWASDIVFTTTGGIGDVDLYTGEGFVPTVTNYSCASQTWTNDERCAHFSGTPGSTRDYNVFLLSFTPFYGVNFKVEYYNRY